MNHPPGKDMPAERHTSPYLMLPSPTMASVSTGSSSTSPPGISIDQDIDSIARINSQNQCDTAPKDLDLGTEQSHVGQKILSSCLAPSPPLSTWGERPDLPHLPAGHRVDKEHTQGYWKKDGSSSFLVVLRIQAFKTHDHMIKAETASFPARKLREREVDGKARRTSSCKKKKALGGNQKPIISKSEAARILMKIRREAQMVLGEQTIEEREVAEILTNLSQTVSLQGRMSEESSSSGVFLPKTTRWGENRGKKEEVDLTPHRDFSHSTPAPRNVAAETLLEQDQEIPALSKTDTLSKAGDPSDRSIVTRSQARSQGNLPDNEEYAMERKLGYPVPTAPISKEYNPPAHIPESRKRPLSPTEDPLPPYMKKPSASGSKKATFYHGPPSYLTDPNRTDPYANPANIAQAPDGSFELVAPNIHHRPAPHKKLQRPRISSRRFRAFHSMSSSSEVTMPPGHMSNILGRPHWTSTSEGSRNVTIPPHYMLMKPQPFHNTQNDFGNAALPRTPTSDPETLLARPLTPEESHPVPGHDRSNLYEDQSCAYHKTENQSPRKRPYKRRKKRPNEDQQQKRSKLEQFRLDKEARRIRDEQEHFGGLVNFKGRQRGWNGQRKSDHQWPVEKRAPDAEQKNAKTSFSMPQSFEDNRNPKKPASSSTISTNQLRADYDGVRTREAVYAMTIEDASRVAERKAKEYSASVTWDYDYVSRGGLRTMSPKKVETSEGDEGDDICGPNNQS
ncbi:hypothetical protein JHW43_000737 [Diplocarpon mali]|nr:hypothetical protein JHW43_000737 [Diplocarpon mali]